MGLEHVVAAVMVGGLVLYVLGGGADFGGGLWDLLAFGPRKNEQRAVIERAIGPVWEANHVWFIFVFVLLFSAFPPAFTHLTTRFFDLLTAYAVGLVLRGSAFVFRHYEQDDRKRRRYGALFSAASVGCPLLLGGMGALLVREGELGSSFADPFVLAGAVFFLAVVAALAATYLTLEATDDALREDFRRRALGALVVAGVASWVALLAGREAAPLLVSRVAGRGVAVVATAFGVASLLLLLRRRYELARAGVAMLSATVVIGWAIAKGEVLVPPSFTLTSSKAHDATLQVLLVACGLGAVILVPSLWLLLRIFAPIRRKGEVTRMGS